MTDARVFMFKLQPMIYKHYIDNIGRDVRQVAALENPSKFIRDQEMGPGSMTRLRYNMDKKNERFAWYTRNPSGGHSLEYVAIGKNTESFGVCEDRFEKVIVNKDGLNKLSTSEAIDYLEQNKADFTPKSYYKLKKSFELLKSKLK